MGFNLTILFILAGLFFIQPAYAYLDPTTAGSVFSAMAVILPAILAFFGFLFSPVKRLIKYVIAKSKRSGR